jgi:hypothetical protein
MADISLLKTSPMEKDAEPVFGYRLYRNELFKGEYKCRMSVLKCIRAGPKM